jgi:hypothetical protein
VGGRGREDGEGALCCCQGELKKKNSSVVIALFTASTDFPKMS